MLLIAWGKIDHVFFIYLLANDAWTHFYGLASGELLNAWVIFKILILNVEICFQWPLSSCLVCLTYGILILTSMDLLLLHWASSCVRSCNDSLLLLRCHCFEIWLALGYWTICVWSFGNQWWSYFVQKHWLIVKIHFIRFSLLNDFVDALAQICWLKMGTSLWALILLASIIVRIDSFVVCKVNILFVRILCLSWCSFLVIIIIIILSVQTHIILVIWLVRQLVEIVFVFMLTSIEIGIEIASSHVVSTIVSLLSVNSSLISLHIFSYFEFFKLKEL